MTFLKCVFGGEDGAGFAEPWILVVLNSTIISFIHTAWLSYGLGTLVYGVHSQGGRLTKLPSCGHYELTNFYVIFGISPQNFIFFN